VNVEVAEPTPERTDTPKVEVTPEKDLPRGQVARRYGDRTVRASAAPELHAELERLFEVMDQMHGQGLAFRAGQKMPIGWTTLTLVDEAGDLVVHEPDYDAADPEAASRADLSVSLRMLGEQRHVLELASVEGEAVDFDEHVLVVRGALTAEQVFLFRVVSPGGRTTGWRITPAEDGEGEMEVDSLPVHRVLSARAPLVSVFLLPAGFGAVFDGADLTSVIGPDDNVVWHREGAE
jgi:hypothetical protein